MRRIEISNIELAPEGYMVHFADCQYTYDEEEMQELIALFIDKKQYSDASKLLKALK